MEYMDINIQAPVELVINTNTFGKGPCGEQYKVGINLDHGMCAVYYEQVDNNGDRSIYHQSQYAIRATDHGLQYYDYSWRYFCKRAQEEYAGYLMEKEVGINE